MAGSAADTTQPSEPSKTVIGRVGVVGLGHMGHAFAANLIEDGYQVSANDRDPKRTAALTVARPVGQLADLAACDVVVTSLPDDDAFAEVARGWSAFSRRVRSTFPPARSARRFPVAWPRNMRATACQRKCLRNHRNAEIGERGQVE